MQKKICPICERPLTGSGYCRLCRKLVFKPLIREVDYYLNETRPGQQTALNERNGGRSQTALEVSEKDFREKTADFYQDMKQKSGRGRRSRRPPGRPKKRPVKRRLYGMSRFRRNLLKRQTGKGAR